MRLTLVGLAAASLLANFHSVFAIQDTDRTTFHGAAVYLADSGINNRFLRTQKSVDDASSNDHGDSDEDRGRLTLQDAEKMLHRMENFGKARPGVNRVAGLAELSREQLKRWFATSQRNVLFREMKNDGMNPATLSKVLGLDDIVKALPASKLMENGEYILFQQFSRFWYKESGKAKKLLPPVPSV